MPNTKVHLCQPEHAVLPGGMQNLYEKLGLDPASVEAGVVLVRSHVAYHAGNRAAEMIDISACRTRKYRFELYGRKYHVEVVDRYDHRFGVTGFCDR